MTNEYTFPFSTCEKISSSYVAQPYSALTNVANCIIITYFLVRIRNQYVFMFLLSLLLFEVFHTFSHIIHIAGNLQVNITHTLSYLINFSFVYFIINYTKYYPSFPAIILYLLLICFDIYAFTHLNIAFFILSQGILFISVLLYYYSMLPKILKARFPLLVVLIIFIVFLVLNEIYNCDTMLQFNQDIPYHVMNESAGIALFYLLSSSVYRA